MNGLLLTFALLSADPTATEKANVLALAPDAAVTVTAVHDGQWDSPDVWSGSALPADGDNVLVPAGRIVLIDHADTARLNSVRVDGTLEFSPTEATQLLCDTLVCSSGGTLEIGTEVSPITGSAKIVFIDDGELTSGLSRGLVSLGMVSIHGEPKQFSKGVVRDGTAWKPADSLERTVTFTSESTDPLRRGHVMLMHHADYSVSWAAFNGLGRTDKSKPIGGTNLRGRYPLHYHRCGLEKPISVTGVVVSGSVGWGVVNHSSNVACSESISFDVLGAGFVTESGNERGAFKNCLAVQSTGSGQDRHERKAIGDFGHSGHGFWTQGCDVSVTDCVAVGHAHAAFFTHSQGFKEPDTGLVADTTSSTRPLAEFARNVARHSKVGLEFEWVSQSDERSKMLDCKAEHCVTGFRCRNSKIDIPSGEFRGDDNKGIGLHFVTAYSGIGNVSNVTVTGFAEGMYIADIADVNVTGGTWDNEIDFRIAEHQDANARIDVPGASYFFRNNPHNSQPVSTFFTKRGKVWIEGKRAYFDCQRPDFIRWPTGTTIYVGMTNQQIFDMYGLLPKGEMLPAGCTSKGTYWIAP